MWRTLLLFCYLFPATIFAQQKSAFLASKVLDEKGVPLVFANLQIVDSFDDEVSNAAGRFVVMAQKIGAVKISASLIGHETAEQAIRLIAGDTARVKFILKETLVNLQDVVVTASAFATGDEGKGVTLRRMEVVTTPGAAAFDLSFRHWPPGDTDCRRASQR